MSAEEIIVNNKIIAKFMGNKMNGDYYVSGYDAKFPTTILVHPSDLAYDEDWNWIMPVVEKISIIASDNPNTKLYEQAGKVLSTNICCSVETVWNRVVEFIKWYNENK